MAYEHIQLTRDRGIVTLALDRPETRNAMSAAMGEEVARAVDEVREDPEARVLIITGAGTAFSSGGDLGMLARDAELSKDAGASAVAGSLRAFYSRYLAIRSLSIPTIAAINGHAIGAGLCLALACDLRVAVEDAKMGMTFAKLGLHPGMGGTYFLPRVIGLARACELFFTGRLIDAAEADRLGLLNRVVARDEFTATVRALAADIAAGAPLAVQMVKKSVYRGIDHSLDDMLDFEAFHQAITLCTADAREGIAAVMEKRAPSFTGR